MKTFSPTLKALLAGAALKMAVIGRLFFPSGTVYASDATSDIAWNGQTYVGLDQAAAVEVPPTSLSDTGTGGTFKLSATDGPLLASVQTEDYRGQPAEAAILVFDPATGLPVEEIGFLKGKMDVATISDSEAKPAQPGSQAEPQVSTLAITVATQAADLKRTGSRTQSDADQRHFRDPNDGFFKDKGVAGHTQIWWGQSPPATAAVASGAYTGRGAQPLPNLA